METDADCSNVLSDNGPPCLNITGDTLKSSNSSKPITIKKSDRRLRSRPQKIIITNLDPITRGNGNWILTQQPIKKLGWFNRNKPRKVYGTITSLPDYDSTAHLTRIDQTRIRKCSDKSRMGSICESHLYNEITGWYSSETFNYF